jgi:ATP-dependent Lon protease
MELQEKILKYFDGKVVRKDLTKVIKGNAVVPIYVLEYLLGQHCASSDDDIISQGMEKVKGIIRDHFVHRDEAEMVKSAIKEKSEHKVIDKVSVRLNESKNVYEAFFINLGLQKIPIADHVIKKHSKLLTGGVWCIVTMGYLFESGNRIPWMVNDLKPIQISSIDLDVVLELRKEFTKDEWIDLLIQSIGLEPSEFTTRTKLLQLSRLIPHCENNYNFIELGPKGTGKSHVFSELSPHGILISGGDVTKAKLFVNNTQNQIGLVGYWDVVAFDEFAGSDKKSDKKLVDIMKNYMANKSFSRGNDVFGATASFAFVGNTEHSVPYMIKNSNLFDCLPKAYYDSAFLDRVHIYLPGWEINKLRNEMFTSKYGLIVDYLAEILKELRKDDFANQMNDHVQWDSSLTTRDRDAIKKTFSGLMKIIYPHGAYTHKEAIEIIEFAAEGRKRVKDQLIRIDSTFESVSFSYEDLVTKEKVQIKTLEEVEYNHIAYIKSPDAPEEVEDVQPAQVETKPVAKPGQFIIRENQSNISMKKLFASYLLGSSKILLTDPYIRKPYQMDLLLEFCSFLVEMKPDDEEIKLGIITSEDFEFSIDYLSRKFDEITESLFDSGIILTYEFKKNIHDRSILADNGWKIVLGRGLDFFQRPEGRFNIAKFLQNKRKCKACEITYIQSK